MKALFQMYREHLVEQILNAVVLPSSSTTESSDEGPKRSSTPEALTLIKLLNDSHCK